jgi:co-chaperonin GroES (HSP10)
MRVLRGRVVVRVDDDEPSKLIYVHRGDPREQRIHRGEVLAIGPGAYSKGGVEVPIDVKIGQRVIFHFEGTEDGRTAPWTDGAPALWLAQREVDAVIEE